MKNKFTSMEHFQTVALVFLALGIIGCDSGTSSPGTDPVENKTIVCFGDSLTEGYGASKPGAVDKSKSYPAFLQEKVKAVVINSGKSGDTTSDGLARLEKDVLSKNPDIVIILLGANNFLNRESASSTKNDLKTIIDKVKNENRKIYLVSFVGDSTWEEAYLKIIPDILAPSVKNIIDEYKNIYLQLSSENKDIELIQNIWTGIDYTKMSDPIHPNADGYKIIADNIFNAINPYLRQNNLLK